MVRETLGSKHICVTGGAGFLGQAVCAALRRHGVNNIVVPRSRDYDLTCAAAVARLFDDAKPQIVIHLAAEVGGIGANHARPGRFFFANLAMGMNLIEESRRRGLEKFVQVGTVCAYPGECPTPFRESDLWNGYPEPTNAPYGVAKRALGVMLDAYAREYGLRSAYVIPVNLYGPGDNFDLQTSHVIPAMIRKFCEAADHGAKSATCWGSGEASREFLYVDDAAEAIVRAAAKLDEPTPINLGTGQEVRICDLAAMIADLCGFSGRIIWDSTRPDGQRRRCLDISVAFDRLNWRSGTALEDGLRRTVEWWRARTPPRRRAASAGV